VTLFYSVGNPGDDKRFLTDGALAGIARQFKLQNADIKGQNARVRQRRIVSSQLAVLDSHHFLLSSPLLPMSRGSLK
jgi:hypothetical protein